MTLRIAKSVMSTKSDPCYQLSLFMWNFAFQLPLDFWAIAFHFCCLWQRFTEAGNDPHKWSILTPLSDFVDGIMEMMISHLCFVEMEISFSHY